MAGHVTARPPLDLSRLAPSGVPGLDNVLKGGLARGRLFLVEGVPGSGKTTLAMQFLIEGARAGETVLHVTLSESTEELETVAASHGWTLEGITIREFLPQVETLTADEQYTMYHPSEVELSLTTKAILQDVERLKPTRVVFDSLSEMRLVAGSPLRYRRQILALKQFFVDRNCTVLLLDDMATSDQDLHVESIAHGVIRLQYLSQEYGAERRRLRVIKYRGTAFRGGYHDYVIATGGLQVFPRLVAAEHRGPAIGGKLATDIPQLDALLGGGIEQGTSTLIVGAAGTGKSTIAIKLCCAAAARGQKSIAFMFDENPNTLLTRAAGLHIDAQERVDEGVLQLVQVDPAELSQGEFAHRIRRSVEDWGASIVVIDSLNGYLNAMPEERFLTIHLHELLMYLNQVGVATVLIGAHQGLIGTQMRTPVDASYLADAVILLRYFEARGEVRKAISVVKKRGGQHECTIREFSMADGQLQVGEALSQFRGVLTGVPVYEGSREPFTGEPNER